jgi:hypothetical protein
VGAAGRSRVLWFLKRILNLAFVTFSLKHCRSDLLFQRYPGLAFQMRTLRQNFTAAAVAEYFCGERLHTG